MNCKECNDLATYLAYIRSEIMVERWIYLTKTNQPLFYYGKSNAYIIPNSNAFDALKCHKQYIDALTALDTLVLSFVKRKPLKCFIISLEKYKSFDNSIFWDNWTNYIFSMLNVFIP